MRIKIIVLISLLLISNQFFAQHDNEYLRSNSQFYEKLKVKDTPLEELKSDWSERELTAKISSYFKDKMAERYFHK